MSRQTFIPREKLSKKKQKELNRKKRVLWAFSPVSRVKEDKTKYDRKKLRRDPDDPDGVFSSGRFMLHNLQAGNTLFLETVTAT